MIVVDASVLVTALIDHDDSGAQYRARLAADLDQHAPAVLDLEVVAAVRRLARGGLGDTRADEVVADLSGLSIRRYPHLALLPRIWELRHNVTPYDAAYVALAEVLGAPLLTADARLATAPGIRCGVELLA